MRSSGQRPALHRPLYTTDERRRRDASGWTLVQGVLAPVQFLIFLVSLGLVLRFLATGEGQFAASSMSNTSTPANFLNRQALPSITGLLARGTMLPRPSTAVPLVMTPTSLARDVKSAAKLGLA